MTAQLELHPQGGLGLARETGVNAWRKHNRKMPFFLNNQQQQLRILQGSERKHIAQR